MKGTVYCLYPSVKSENLTGITTFLISLPSLADFSKTSTTPFLKMVPDKKRL